MNFLRALRRLGQQSNGWQKAADDLNSQLPIIEKLYSRNGLRIHLTCSACPEQYEVFKGDRQAGYLRLRHGEFRVDYPHCGGETIYEDNPIGDGTFDPEERLVFLTRAMRVILKKLITSPNK